MNKNPSVFIVVLIVAVISSFYGGMKYQQSKTPSLSAFQQLGNMAASDGGRIIRQPNGEAGQIGNRIRFSGGQTMGEIISVDDDSITVKLADGSTKIILVPQSASINKSDEGDKSDLVVGVNIAVFGSGNDDGSITAQNIQLNPSLRNFNDSIPNE